MGFDRALVLEVFFACNKNEELAANYLLDHMHEFEDWLKSPFSCSPPPFFFFFSMLGAYTLLWLNSVLYQLYALWSLENTCQDVHVASLSLDANIFSIYFS